MNFSLGFGFIFQDKEWFKKLILPGLVLLIPIVGWMITLGWALRVTKNVISGVEEPLPDLDFGGDIIRGFFAFLISFIYSLPVSALSTITGWFGNWNISGNSASYTLIGVFTALIGLAAFVLGLVTSFITLPAIANYIAYDDFGAAFRLGEVFGLIKTNFGGWLIVALGSLLAVGLIAPLGAIACIIGLVVTIPYSFAVMGHLMGQAYVETRSKA